MILIVGLGNPGPKCKYTRHNIGFRTIDNLQLTMGGFSDWKNIKKMQAEISQGVICGQKTLLAKPQIFMNNSGIAVKKIIGNWKPRARNFVSVRGRLEIGNLIVIHDDIDLPLGKIRIVKNRGAAGHKGVESIIHGLKTKDFTRFRLGIRPSEKLKAKSEKQLKKFVLEKFTKKEEEFVKEIVKKTTEAVELSLKESLEKAMNQYNK